MGMPVQVDMCEACGKTVVAQQPGRDAYRGECGAKQIEGPEAETEERMAGKQRRIFPAFINLFYRKQCHRGS
jgi:hypothetical protein